MQTATKQLDVYESIMKNLLALKEDTKIRETDTKRLDAYESIIQNLFNLKEEVIEPKHQAERSGSDSGYTAYSFRPT